MAKFWCINCKGERDHAYTSCGGACDNNCYNRCRSCGKETLVSADLTTSKKNLTTNEMIALAQMSGKTGELVIKGGTGNVHTGQRNDRGVAYNTHTGDYSYFVVEQNK